MGEAEKCFEGGEKGKLMSVCCMSAQNGETDNRFENYRQLWKREKNIEHFKSKLKTFLPLGHPFLGEFK